MGRRSEIAVGMICIAVAGCATRVGVRRTDDEAWFRVAQRSALDGHQLSEGTLLFLRQRDLLALQRRDTLRVLDRLHRELCRDRSRATASALAELSYLEAKRRPERSDETIQLYVSALVYAYAYLFDAKLESSPNVYDPRFRMACDLYNRSVARIVAFAQRKNLRWGDPLRLSSPAGPIEFEFKTHDAAWPPGTFDRIFPVYEFAVDGLQNHYRTSGLGVPLVGLRTRRPHSPEDRFFSQEAELALPATLLLEIEGSVIDPRNEESARTVVVKLYDPLRTGRAEINGITVPLETDVTTPLAYMLDHSPPISGITGLLDVESWAERRGLYMLGPYRPDKIPLVLVHGLVSSPMTWLEMINEFLGDAELRQRYQLWYFLYPTGDPFLYSAGALRKSLRDAQRTFDPEQGNARFSQMVVVGHSMGGLLVRSVVTHSGSALWDAVTDRGIETLRIGEKQKDLLRRIFIFEPLPFVRRVVFMAVPHRGAVLADKWYAEFASAMIHVSENLITIGGALAAVLPEDDARLLEERIPTGIDSLSPGAPGIRVLSGLPIGQGVTFHSIIGNRVAADTPGGSDGVVPYTSSHLEGAASEKIVHSGHSITAHPLAIREVRRILLEHAAKLRQNP